MASYFSKYPKILYNNKIITDLISRCALREQLVSKVELYYPYYIVDGDTPEIIASKVYKDPEKHWIILLINNILNPFFDFPLSTTELDSYLDIKYSAQAANTYGSGSEYAKATIKGYQSVITTTDLVSGTITTNITEIDYKSYIGTNDDYHLNYPDYTKQNGSILYNQSKQSYTFYEYEYNLNESNRNIKLLRTELVPQIEADLKNLMKITYG